METLISPCGDALPGSIRACAAWRGTVSMSPPRRRRETANRGSEREEDEAMGVSMNARSCWVVLVIALLASGGMRLPCSLPCSGLSP